MPELPEVETVRRGLAPALEGRVLARVEVRRPDLRIPFPPRFAARLTGRRVQRLDRRAKYLLLHLDGGEALVVHLGMSGRFTLYRPGANRGELLGEYEVDTPPAAAGTGPHDHVVFETDQGVRAVFTDHRRFGLMTLVPSYRLEADPLFAGLGPEPLSEAFDAAALDAALAGKRTPIKAALLDQTVVAGLGNIYVCEALWRARISPKRSALSVPGVRAARLVPAIKDVLAEAVAAGGSTLRDYAQTDGALGYFQHRFAVYDRAGAPCPACAAPVKRLVQAGRSTFYCSRCQR